MKIIFVFPGSFNDIFFKNEIEVLKKYFDKVIVISYHGDESKFKAISKKYDMEYYNSKKYSFLNIFKFDFWRWIFSKEVFKEIKNNCSFSMTGIKRFIYIIYYGLFYLDTKEFVYKNMKKFVDDDIYLYSFWLTRGAYCISNFSKFKKDFNIIKIVSRAHGYDLYTERNSMNYLPFRDFIDKNLDEIHFISEFGLDYYNNKITEDKRSKNFVTRLGSFNYNNIRKKICHKERICIVSCSFINYNKRLDLIIDFLSTVSFDFDWIHIGDGNLRDKMENYAKIKLPENSFKFLGFVENTKILEFYSKYDADFFINMSDSEGIPVTIMEAMSFGIPVIARDVGGISEIVNFDNGFLLREPFNKKIYEEISNFIFNRFSNLEFYNNLCENSRKTWQLKYDLSKNNELFFKNFFE
ncbi:glycosyl transferase family 1 [Oceanotoga teriensis]|uniref:Glycosyl transferase family 1 n=1 Tax=Oceanotoga teriensis TaxID=515440 RepID=A0AA45C538_9BACT|nr:glycosyltransferase [Oceanotoga teriensis]PWJ88077.1 glycosyl transferase family 1 [Oceanotoga teriensis]